MATMIAQEHPVTLDQWLAHLEKLHPSTIDLGLERVEQIAKRLQLDFSQKKVITVGGTNGKGSTVTLLCSILQAAGYTTGSYTSPHIHIYNERVCINLQPVSDQQLCASFAAVENVRGGMTLTYFEFGTLAALQLFSQAEIDYLILEVGLGGRLDAVNVIDADLSILTNVDMDHMEYLGDNREAIGFEKAGIFRSGKPALYGEADIPESVSKHAESTTAVLYRQTREYGWQIEEGGKGQWRWYGTDAQGQTRRLEHLPPTFFNLDNVASVLQALLLIEPALPQDTIVQGVVSAVLPGRLQLIPGPPDTVLDVAHNPHAVRNLLQNLQRHFPHRHLHIVIAMLADKDMAQVVRLMSGLEARWYVGQIADARGADAKILYNLLLEQGVKQAECFESVEAACNAAREDAARDTLILVTGSFYTVADAMALLNGR